MALGLTQTLTEISTRNLPGGKGRPAGASASHNPMDPHALLQGQLHLLILSIDVYNLSLFILFRSSVSL
jgi:hypothetical protein